MGIISIIIVSMQGCGYKKPPYYEKKVQKDVKIIIQSQSEADDIRTKE